MDNKKSFVFYIGTSAELIKLIPVVQAFDRNKINYKIISSGQTDLKEKELAQLADINVSKEVIKRFQDQTSMSHFGVWAIKSFFKTIKVLIQEKEINDDLKIIVHGDTVTSLIGSVAGKIAGAKVLHIESGLRSFNFSQPFPEEICRYITSMLANIHFCPNAWAVNNLKNYRGKKINTIQNTSLEVLKQGLKLNLISNEISSLKEPFFLLILHRQENIMFKKETSLNIIKHVLKYTNKNMKCVFVMHKLTENFLKENGLYEEISKNKNIIIMPRKPYLEFINTINKAEFILTDGGSNQEEAYYMGKPALILRNVTERVEGLDQNIKLMKEDLNTLDEFIKDYRSYRREPVELPSMLPSEIIIENI